MYICIVYVCTHTPNLDVNSLCRLLPPAGDVPTDPQRPAASCSQKSEERPAPHGSGQTQKGPVTSSSNVKTELNFKIVSGFIWNIFKIKKYK